MVSLTGQMYAFFMTVVAGLSVGFLFDLYRLFRSAVGPKRWVSILCDLLYWALVTPTVFLLLLLANWADLRYYVAIGMGLGVFAYFQLLSALVLWASVSMQRTLSSIVTGVGRLLVGLLVWPVRLGFGISRASFLHTSPGRTRPRAPRMRWRTWSFGRIFRQ